jgi:signal transduction histidine kinase
MKEIKRSPSESVKESEIAWTRLDKLRKVSAEISAELNPSKVLRLIIQRGIELLGLDSGGIALWDLERRLFVVHMTVNMPAGFQGSTFRRGEGLSGKVLRSGKTVVLDDYSRSSAALRRLRKRSYKAVIGTPIRLGDRLIGSLNLQTKSPHKWITQQDRFILEALANHAAIAIRNADLFESEQKHLIQAESLRIISRELSAELDLSKVLKQIVRQGIALTRLESGEVFLWSPEGSLKVEAVVNLPPSLAGKRLKPGEDIVARAAGERKTIVADTSHQAGKIFSKELNGKRFKAGIAAPLVWREKVIGVLAFGTQERDRKISKEDQRMIETLSQHAAIAIVNADLFHSLQTLNQELERKVQDRTKELEALHEEIVQNEKFATLGQIAGSVNHELRQPLEVITNAAYYLKLQVERNDIGPIKKDFERFLNIITEECAGAAGLVNELLDFTRRKEAAPHPVELNELIESVLMRIQVPAQITVRKRLDRQLPHIWVDPVQIMRVLSNLVINGLQAMPNGGTLNISTRAGKKEAEVLIRDSGVGIAQENIDRIFQPLFTTKARGIGLGLAIVKQYLDANHGRIAVQSQLGTGTTFRVSLPIFQKPQLSKS